MVIKDASHVFHEALANIYIAFIKFPVKFMFTEEVFFEPSLERT